MYGNNIGAIPNKLVLISESYYSKNILTSGDLNPINIDVFNSGVAVELGYTTNTIGTSGKYSISYF